MLKTGDKSVDMGIKDRSLTIVKSNSHIHVYFKNKPINIGFYKTDGRKAVCFIDILHLFHVKT